MDNYEKAFYAKYGDQNRSAIRSALEFVLWVDEYNPPECEMASVVKTMPETEQQRLKNAVKYVKSLRGETNV